MARYIKGCRIRTNTGLKNMHLFSIYRGIRGFVNLYREVVNIKDKIITEEAHKRAKIVEFFKEFGLKATCRAYNLKKSVIYLWAKKLKDASEDITVLNPESKTPHKKREPKWDYRICEYIKGLREIYGDIGKDKIKVLLDKYCREHNLQTVSSSTVGRIISKKNLFFAKELTHFGKRKIKYKKKKQRRAGYLPQVPGDLMQVDSISIFEMGVKRYILTAIDLIGKFGFGYSYKSLSSKTAEDFMNKLEQVVPFKIKRIQTDNGQEFHKYFDEYLEKNKILHFFTYPRHPQHNANVERFNRTIQDEFLNQNFDLIEDCNLLNYNLVNYLIFYNKDRPHKSLGYVSPCDYLIKERGFSNMLWTSAIT